MPTRNVNLTENSDRFIERGVESGRYRDASEMVVEALGLLEKREAEDQAKLEWLQAAVAEGFDSLDRGEGIPFESVEELEAYFDQIHLDVCAEIAAEPRSA